MSRQLNIWFLGLLAFSIAPTSLFAQTKTYYVRGRAVQLQVDPNYILVKPSIGLDGGQISEVVASEQALNLAKEAIRAQTKLAGGNPTSYIESLEKVPPRIVFPAGGVLVPRVVGLNLSQVGMVKLDETGPPSQVVFKLNDRSVVLKGTITVRFAQPPTDQSLETFQQENKVKLVERPTFASNIARFEPRGLNADDPLTLADKVGERPDVRWAEPDLVYQINKFGTVKEPNDTYYKKQWYLHSGDQGIGAPEAWADSEGSDRITVAVIDDGVDLQHPDLKGKLVAGYDFYNDDDRPQPQKSDSHGTACAGVIGALSDNGVGVAGVAWKCKIMPIRISGGDFFAADDDIAKSFSLAHKRGAKIISCSWGGGPESNKILDAIDEVTDGGCLVIAAAGNALPALDVFFPAKYDRCIAVGAVRKDNVRWNYSCYGPNHEIDLVAPSGDVNYAGDIWTADQTGDAGINPGHGGEQSMDKDYTSLFGGTSAATPVVAGVAALIWSTYPDLRADQIRQILEETATKIDQQGVKWINGRSRFYGFGKVNAYAALQQAKKVAQAQGLRRAQSADMGGGADRKVSDVVEGQPSENTKGEARQKSEPSHEELRRVKRLHHALNPSQEHYEVRGKTITLQPDLDWIALSLSTLPRAPETTDRILERIFEPSFIQRLRVGSQNESWQSWINDSVKIGGYKSDDHRGVIVVRRTTLLDPDELSKAIRDDLPFFLIPVYKSQGSIMAPLGTVSCRLKSPAVEKNFLEFARDHGLNVVEQDGEQFKLSLTRNSEFVDVFEASRALADGGMVKWSEPDFARSLRPFLTIPIGF